jgi:hypothetical protein
MSKYQMATLSVLTAAMLALLIALQTSSHPRSVAAPMPADSSAPPLPAPIEVSHWHLVQ